jgi:hypothetical protein
VLVGFSQLPSNAIAFVLGLFGRRVLGNEPAKTARAIEARNILALRDLEPEGDRLEREALTALFDGGIARWSFSAGRTSTSVSQAG